MKNIINTIALFLILTVLFLCRIGYEIQHQHSPCVEVTHGQGFKRVIGGRQLDAQNFAVPCQIGDFFRIAADNKTVITTFAPTSNGWAIIHFEYVK